MTFNFSYESSSMSSDVPAGKINMPIKNGGYLNQIDGGKKKNSCGIDNNNNNKIKNWNEIVGYLSKSKYR